MLYYQTGPKKRLVVYCCDNESPIILIETSYTKRVHPSADDDELPGMSYNWSNVQYKRKLRLIALIINLSNTQRPFFWIAQMEKVR